MAPARAARSPEARTKGSAPNGQHQYTGPTREAIDDEVLRTILRESLYRYRRELMDYDERDFLWDRIVRLRKQLKLA